MFDLDLVDKKIMAMLCENAEMSHSDIAEEINLSQPTIGTRIRKMEKKKILQKCYGTNFKEVDLLFIKMDIKTTNIDKVIDFLDSDNSVLNVFKTIGGKNDIMVFFCESNIRNIDDFVNILRKMNCKVDYAIITDFLRDLILPTNGKFIKEESK